MKIAFKKEKITKVWCVRLCMAVFGVLIGGASIGFFRVSLFGTDPFQCLLEGVAQVAPISYTHLYMIASGIILVLMYCFGRRYIGITTVVNFLFLGHVVEASEAAVLATFGTPGLAMRIVWLILGVVVMCFGAAVYIVGDMGASPYDSTALMLELNHVIRFSYGRVILDFICVGIGYYLGAVVGVGTVVTAFFMGPLVDFFRKYAAQPFLDRFTKEADDGRTNSTQAA